MTQADLVALWQPILDNLQSLCAKVPDEHPDLDEPLWQGRFETPEGPKEEQALTTRELLAHLAVACYEVPRALTGQGTFDEVKAASGPLRTASLPELRAAFAERAPKLIALIQGTPEDRLTEEIDLPMGGRMAVGSVFQLAALHVMHHKGQLTVSLRLCGVRPGRFIGA